MTLWSSALGCVTRKPLAQQSSKGQEYKATNFVSGLGLYCISLHPPQNNLQNCGCTTQLLVHRPPCNWDKVIRLDCFALAYIRHHEPPAAKSAALSSSLLFIPFTTTTYLSQLPVLLRTSHSKPQTQQTRFLSLPAICDPSSRTSTPSKSARQKRSASARNTPTAFL